MKRILWAMALVFLFGAGSARADCVNPAGVEAEIVYNKDYKVYQFCDGTDWMSMAAGIRYVTGGNPPTDCPNVGDICSDGSVFAGLDGGVPLYATRCDAGMAWDGSACTGGRSTLSWNDGNGVDASNANPNATNNNGAVNTALLIATDSDVSIGGVQLHQAAQYCADAVYHGKGDWYLPSANELNILYGNKAAIGNFSTSATYYWSSSKVDQYHGRGQRFNDGVQTSPYKYNANFVRCARR